MKKSAPKPVDELAKEKLNPARAVSVAALVLALASGLFAWRMISEIDKAKTAQEESQARIDTLEARLIELSQEPPAEIDRLVVPEERAMEALVEVGDIMQALGIPHETYTDKINDFSQGLQKWRAVAVGKGTLEQALSFLEQVEKSPKCKYVLEAFSYTPEEMRLEFSYYVYAEDLR
ncbi:MAG: hypothetical protein LBT59_29180 [Clostridiales bacterium]|jgi:formiminotetrahydrofolate cyclodeaminase|nr:hypothetical protein [Clostridiales bacterium]